MKKNRRLTFIGAALGVALPVIHSMATPLPGGFAPIAPPSGGFGIDGDLWANTPLVDTGDWTRNTNLAPGSGLGVLSPTGVPLDPVRTFHFVDPFNDTGDNIFTGGDKWTDNPNTWGWTTGKPSSKTDINNVLLHIGSDASGHVWAVIAADRLSTSGDSYIDFELLQNPLTLNGNGTFSSSGPNGGRTTNDVLLSIGFSGGGKVADFVASRWQAAGAGFGYTDVTANLPTGRVFVALNSDTVAVPYGAFGATNYAANAFVEAAIDLTALFGNFDPCISVGFKTIMVKTKASTSSSASIEDFIQPIQYSLNIGPGANAGPDQVRCGGGSETAFPLQGEASSGLQSVSSATWSVVSGNATIDDPGSLVTTARVSSPSATLRLTVSQANGCVKTDDILLTVQTPPVCAINGITNTCPRTTNTFSAPTGMGGYSWTVAGNGSISGPANQPTVKVVSGAACGADYTLSLVVTTNVCSASCSIVVAVTDSGAPVLAIPPDVVLDCPASTATNATGTATAMDGCSHAMVTYRDFETNGCGSTRFITRVWTATDECGNFASGVQNITVRDLAPPVLNCPVNRTLEFPADTSPANTGMATATDACGSATVVFSDVVTTNCENTFVIARTWTATDQCGNSSSSTQLITVRDTTAPVITCPADLTLDCPAVTTTDATGVATATDASGPVAVAYTDTMTANCGNTYTISRRWTATDRCNNASSCTQTITIRDNTPPVITCPPDLTLEFPANTTTNATGVATASDACSTATITFVDSVTNGCGGSKTISRRWTATDLCGNSSSCTQTITVRDTTAPVITCPPNLTLECPATTTTNATGVATATDASGTVTITYADTITAGCGNTYAISRRWTATDPCNNASSCTQTIVVQDTKAPVITCPPNLTLEYPADTTTNATGVATAQDNCSGVTIACSDWVSTGCGKTKVIYRAWTAKDECGNVASAFQTITVQDTTPPTINCPPWATVECGESTDPDHTGWATGLDAGGNVSVSYADGPPQPLCGATKFIGRTWIVADQCGNVSYCHQRITVRDTTPPTLTLPPDRVLDCPGDTRTNVTGVATAVDGCGSVVISYSDVVSNSCGISRTVKRTWTATDQCGNSTNGLQTITVRDVTPPTVTCPNIKVQCVGDVPPPYANLAAFLAAGGKATDACDSELTLSLTSDSGLLGHCPGQVIRVYRVTDDCGNFTECTQTITVADTIPPVLACPPSVTVECGASLDLAKTGRATATDNCSTNVTITHNDIPVSSSYLVKWYAADPGLGAGPYAPTYVKLAPGSLPCSGLARSVGLDLDPLRNAVAFASPSGQLDALTSLGGEPMALGQVVPFEAVIEVGGGPGPERGTIEFTSSWSTHTTSNERFGYDTNYMVYCAFVDFADPGTIDPKYNARLESFSSSVVNPGTINEKIQGKFRVTGLDSGDRVIVEIWVVLASTKPGQVGGTIASDLVSAQKATVPPEPITTGAQTVSIGNLSKITALPPPQAQPPLGPLPPQPPALPGATVNVIDRTWTATDECGNRGTCVQRITVRDTTPPVITPPPSLTLEYPADLSTNNAGVATAQDGCSPVVVSYSDIVSNSCGVARTVGRLWIATDLGGNSSSAWQTLIVRDTTAPVITCPLDATVEYGDDTSTNSLGAATASDFSGTTTITFRDTITTNCGNACIISRQWSAADACGNRADCTQTITVADTTPPTLEVGANKTVNIGDPIVFDAPVATDNCSTATVKVISTATNYPTLSSYTTSDALYVVTRTWNAADACGNVSPNESQAITVMPTLTPSWLEIVKVSVDTIMLRWPTEASDYRLESSTDLKSWSPVAITPLTVNGEYRVYMTLTAPRQFFRLKK